MITKSHHNVLISLFFALLLVTVLGMAVIMYLLQTKTKVAERSETPLGENLDNVGVDYIKTLPFYEANQSPIIFEGAVSQDVLAYVYKTGDAVYKINLTYRDGQIVGQKVSVADTAEVFFVVSPEPHQIINKRSVIVSGSQTGELIKVELNGTIVAAVDPSFVVEFSPVPSGNHLIIITSGESRLEIPVVVVNP